jgi:hypothetical protein
MAVLLAGKQKAQSLWEYNQMKRILPLFLDQYHKTILATNA